MKILRITLTNIASLAGQHTVDFTQEPLRSAGLYAISGDTGSGKSSLLDAMCLALYGKTPRLKDSKTSLEKINNDEKQLDPRTLLRRGTAEGMAEVAFVGVDGKPWTARWSVRRARKSVSGKLQQVDRTLFQGQIDPAGDGTIESGGKKTEVDAAIQEKLGLTFDQFTRAVLLAQNEFAVFLQSDDKARAEILQALTGTGRFEEISKAVFERSKIERQKINDLQSQLKGGSVLSDDDRAEKTAKLADATAQMAKLQSQQKQLEAEQEWHRKLEKHAAALTTTQTELEAAQKTLAESEPRKQQLRHTEYALRHAAPLKRASEEAESALAKSQAAIKTAAESVRKIEDESKQAVAKVEAAEAHFNLCKAAVETLQPKLIQAAKLEESARLQTDSVNKANHALQLAVKEHQKADELEKQTSETLKTAQEKRNDLTQQQQELSHYKPFVAQADSWTDRMEQAAATREKSDESTQRLSESNKHLLTLIEQQKVAADDWQKLSAQLTASQAELQSAESMAQQFDRSKLSQQRDLQQQRQEIWNSLKTYLQKVQESEHELNACQSKLEKCDEAIRLQDAEIKRLTETDVPAAALVVEQQEASLKVVQKAISDEAIRLRTQLNENEPCSVCGSTQHPYSAEPPSADQAAVKALQQRLQEAQTNLKNLNQQTATLEAERTANHGRRTEHQSALKQLKKERQELSFPYADHKEFVPAQETPIDQQLAEAEAQLAKLRDDLQNLKLQEQQAANAEKTLAQSQKQVQEIQAQERKASELLTRIQQSVGKAESDNQHLQQRDKERRTELQNQLLLLQQLFAEIPNSQNQFEADPTAFRDAFRTAVDSVADVEKQITEIDATIKQTSDKLETVQPLSAEALKRKLDLQKEATDAQKQLEDLKQQQNELFDGRSADAAKSETDQQFKDAEQQLKTTEQARTESEKQLAAAKQNSIQIQKQHLEAEQKVAATTQSLKKWLGEFNQKESIELSDTDLNLMLSRNDEWLKSEGEELGKLATAVQTKTGQLETLQSQQLDLQNSRPSEKSLEEVTQQLEANSVETKDVQQQKEGVQKELNVDDAQREKNKTLQEQITEQEVTATPWIRLNEVIGSSDGSSFRNIAQRHTLDILLRFANHQLRLLSGRYRLERIPNSLNLMVVDQEMADERRSIHSLSGGESFLVSLALALGLASLTSNRLKIESLFIDEGFGSLDPNTLDLAMNALMQLESQGRKVGIISHVTTMTDAIPVQIKVAKGSSGASTIQVPMNSNIRKRRTPSSPTPTMQKSLFPDD